MVEISHICTYREEHSKLYSQLRMRGTSFITLAAILRFQVFLSVYVANKQARLLDYRRFYIISRL